MKKPGFVKCHSQINGVGIGYQLHLLKWPPNFVLTLTFNTMHRRPANKHVSINHSSRKNI